jgi:hypothetical protein
LLEILGVFDDQYVQYHGFVVHGLLLSPDLSEALEKEGFEVVEERDDGFAAIMVPEVRGPLIWRNYSAV